MDILTITGWIGVAVFASGICLVLGLIFGFLIVSEFDLPKVDKVFNKVIAYSFPIFVISLLLIGVIYGYTWMSLEGKFGNNKDEYIDKINNTFAYLVVQRVEDKNISVDDIVEKSSIIRSLIANTCSEGFQSEGCVRLMDNKFKQVNDSISYYTNSVDNEIKQLKGE